MDAIWILDSKKNDRFAFEIRNVIHLDSVNENAKLIPAYIIGSDDIVVCTPLPDYEFVNLPAHIWHKYANFMHTAMICQRFMDIYTCIHTCIVHWIQIISHFADIILFNRYLYLCMNFNKNIYKTCSSRASFYELILRTMESTFPLRLS
jgi:hypothetical protein